MGCLQIALVAIVAASCRAASLDAATLERVMACEIPELSDEALRGASEALAQGVRQLVGRALSRHREDRFESAREMLETVNRWLDKARRTLLPHGPRATRSSARHLIRSLRTVLEDTDEFLKKETPTPPKPRGKCRSGHITSTDLDTSNRIAGKWNFDRFCIICDGIFRQIQAGRQRDEPICHTHTHTTKHCCKLVLCCTLPATDRQPKT